MATKGPRKPAGKPVAPKVGAKPAPKVAATVAEKPVPVVEAEFVAPPVAEPVPAASAAPQEVVESKPVETLAATVDEAAGVAADKVEAVVEEAVQETIVEPVIAAEAIVDSAKESNVMETIETNFAKAQALFADFNDRAKAAVEKSTKLAEEANEFAKGNLEAFVESGKIAAKGFEAFGQEAAEYNRKAFENATATMKSLSSVKSPTEFFKLQSDFFRTSFDSAVAEASKGTEALIKLAGDAAAPISNRVALAAEKAKLAA